MKKLMAKTPKVRREGMQIAKVVSKKLPPQAKRSWWQAVRKAVAYAPQVYQYGRRAFRELDRQLERVGAVRANDWIRDNIWQPFWNGVGNVGLLAAEGVGTALTTIFLRNHQQAMYDHPIGPPNVGDNLYGINFNGHY